MDDDPAPVTKKCGRPEGGETRGQGHRKKNRLGYVQKRNGNECNKKQAEDVAEPSIINYNELSSSEVDAEDATPNIATNDIVEDESDSEIEYGDDNEDELVNAGDIDGLVEFIEERNEPVFQTDTV